MHKLLSYRCFTSSLFIGLASKSSLSSMTSVSSSSSSPWIKSKSPYKLICDLTLKHSLSKYKNTYNS